MAKETRPKRPRDVNVLARRIVDLVTGAAEDEASAPHRRGEERGLDDEGPANVARRVPQRKSKAVARPKKKSSK
jgi:hypothetical protein